jgi:hypothetical protein
MFKLSFPISSSDVKINLRDAILLIGSCFSDSIGNYLNEFKFNTLSNPFGTIYNPISILELIRHANEDFQPEVIKNGDVYYDWKVHSKVSSLSRQNLIDNLHKQQKTFSEFISDAKWIIMTPGTAWGYFLKDTHRLVANCHKMPDRTFRKELLSIKSITDHFEQTYRSVSQINPEIKWILTVSPVRHLRDGLVGNNRSKAILLESVHQVVDQYPNVYYFPAYEIVMDELRDYRFFEENLSHPNQQSINYVWQRFSETYFDKETLSFLHSWSKIRHALKHRPFHPTSESHQQFLKRTISTVREFGSLVDVTNEIKQLKEQIK